MAGFNTNRVAKKAGVSVGSLYQYFPNKQALARNLIGNRVRVAEALKPAELREDAATTLEEGILASIRWHLAVHLDNPLLETALNRLATEVLEVGEHDAFERRYHEAVGRFLTRHADRLRIGDTSVAALLVTQLLLTVPNRALIHHPAALKDGRIEKELSEMILRYLTGTDPINS